MFNVPLNLKETIGEVVRALAYTNLERGLDMIEDLKLPDDLILGDPVRIHQLLFNLLSNAIKFTPRGSVTTAAKVDAETAHRIRVTISVTDTGIGISKEQLSRLFKPFSQADNSTQRSYGGSGLGLSICKAMVENVLGGKIWIESKPGEGTKVSFTVTFNKAPKDAKGTPKEITAEAPDPMANWSQDAGLDGHVVPAKASFRDLSKIPRSEIRVCIVEDNPINQKIAISFIKRMDLYCEAFNDGKQAVEALRKKAKEKSEFHLVLMDCQMPVMDGYEATRAIREDSDPNVREVIVIAMTASAIRGDREKCLEAGMNNYLAKPVRANVLSAMLDEYLSNSPTELPNMSDPEHQPTHSVKEQRNGKKAENGSKERDGDTRHSPTASGDVTPTPPSPVDASFKKPTKRPVRKIKRPSGSGNIAINNKPQIAAQAAQGASAESNKDVSTNDFAAEDAATAAALPVPVTEASLKAKDEMEQRGQGGRDPITAARDDENHPLAKFKKIVENSNESTRTGVD